MTHASKLQGLDLEVSRLRGLIDIEDVRLLEALAARMELVKEIGAIKARADSPIIDTQREIQLLTGIRGLASRLGLDGDLCEELFENILRYSRKLQQGLRDEVPFMMEGGWMDNDLIL